MPFPARNASKDASWPLPRFRSFPRSTAPKYCAPVVSRRGTRPPLTRAARRGGLAVIGRPAIACLGCPRRTHDCVRDYVYAARSCVTKPFHDPTLRNAGLASLRVYSLIRACAPVPGLPRSRRPQSLHVVPTESATSSLVLRGRPWKASQGLGGTAVNRLVYHACLLRHFTGLRLLSIGGAPTRACRPAAFGRDPSPRCADHQTVSRLYNGNARKLVLPGVSEFDPRGAATCPRRRRSRVNADFH